MNELQLGIEALRSQEAARVEQRVRSRPVVALVIVSVTAVVGAVWWAFPDEPIAGELTSAWVTGVLGAWCLTFAAAAAVFDQWGAQHVVSRWWVNAELITRTGGLLVLMVLSGRAMLPFLLINLVSGYFWRGLSEPRLRSTLSLYAVCHLLGVLGCVVTGRWGTATVVVLSALAVIAVRTMLSRSTERSLRGRVERDLAERELLALGVSTVRDRIARELHDGLGADLTALLLRLRDAGDERREFKPLQSEAQSIFEELRLTVWVLKHESSTLRDLGQLLASSCRRLCGPIPFSPAKEGFDPAQPIDPADAAHAARTAQELVRCLANTPGTQSIRLRLTAVGTGAIDLSIESQTEGAATLPDGLEAVRTGLSRASGTLRCDTLPGGVRLVAQVPIGNARVAPEAVTEAR